MIGFGMSWLSGPGSRPSGIWSGYSGSGAGPGSGPRTRLPAPGARSPWPV